MRPSPRRLLALAAIVGTLGLSACSSSGSASADADAETDATSVDVTDAPTTEAPTTVAPTTTQAPVETDAPPSTEAPVGPDTTPLTYIDPTTLLKQVPGYDQVAAPDDVAAGLVATFSANPDIVAAIDAIGGVSLFSQTTQAETRVLLVNLRETPTVETAEQFSVGVIGDGTDVRSGSVAGYTGSLYTDSDGAPSFVTVRSTTGVLATAETEDELIAALDAFFVANPDV